MDGSLMFRDVYLCEDVKGLWMSPGYTCWRWLDHEVYVSMIRQEDALFCHFSAGKQAVRYIKQAVNEFCCLVSDMMKWCNKIMACITLPSVERLVRKCNFEHVIDYEYLKVYARFIR